MNEYMTPDKCDECVCIGGTYICRLAVLPCPVMRNEKCANGFFRDSTTPEERAKSFEDAIKRIANEVEE